MTNDWKCTACDWHGDEIEIRKEEYFKETRLEPAEWVWHCPVCHNTDTIEQCVAFYCRTCDDEQVQHDGDQCTECATCALEKEWDNANDH